jgi:anti-anti-sigma regulatory factor
MSTNMPEHLFEMSGEVTAADIPALEARLAEALSSEDRDLLIDARRVTTFDDAALVAFTTARSNAKFHHHRIVALDRQGGALTASLRRTGLIFRFPVFPDADKATAALSADRAALAKKGTSARPIALTT